MATRYEKVLKRRKKQRRPVPEQQKSPAILPGFP
jgi:hypothetical protein